MRLVPTGSGLPVMGQPNMRLATALRDCGGGAKYETFEQYIKRYRRSNEPCVGGARAPELWALSRRAAACSGTIASPDDTGHERCPGSWILAMYCVHPASVGSLLLNSCVVWRSPRPGGPLPSESCWLRRGVS